MKKTSKTNRLLSWVLCLCMVLGMMPGISSGMANAAGTEGMITIEMSDSYGDGWNGNAIEIYANGERLDTATIGDGKTGTWSVVPYSHATYTFKWVKGSYPDETSFVIYMGTEEKCSAAGNSYRSGDTILTLEPVCSAPVFENDICTLCGNVCGVHSFTGNVCSICGFACGTDAAHNWDMGVCTVCAMECAHASWADYVCDNCGYACGSDAKHSFADSICTICGFACGTDAAHDWQSGVCAVCVLRCAHESITDGLCDTCSGTCGTTFAHSFNSDNQCTVCGFVCLHTWESGRCTVCGRVCTHESYSNGFCTVCDDYQPATDADGDGYYDIANGGNLYWFAKQVNDGNRSIYGELTADIVVNETVLNADGTLKGDGSDLRAWTPAGYSRALSFNGKFNGNDHTISGLYYSGDGEYVGLFGCVRDGRIENVGVVDSYFSTTSKFANMGAVAGYLYNAGNSEIINCYNAGAVYGYNAVGGVVGFGQGGTVTGCYNTGWVSSNDRVGGVVGNAENTMIANCYNTGRLQASCLYAGGVVGRYFHKDGSVVLSNCYNTGDVVNTKSYGSAGGVVGNCATHMADCYSIGSVSAASHAGGLAGLLNGTSLTMSNCYYNSDAFTGEAVGDNYGTVTNCPGLSIEQFYSGEVCWLLNGSSSEGAWKQTLGNDTLPGFSGETVYQVSGTYCTGGEATVYSNTDANAGAVHKDETNDHLCDGCGETASECRDWNKDHLCDVCSEVLSQHSGGTATCSAKAKCSYCGEEYGETDPSNHDSSVSFDANGFCPNGCYAPAVQNADGYYEIKNAGQLYWFAQLVNLKGELAAKGILTADIDLGGRTWYPIGLYNDPAMADGDAVIAHYSGVFDGNGHTVSNFKAIGNGSQGFVGYSAAAAIVKNLGVINAEVSGWNAGAVMAYSGTVENCYALDCKITASSNASDVLYAGSIAGTQQATVRNSFAYNCTLTEAEGESATMGAIGGKTPENSYYGKLTVTSGTLRTKGGETEMSEEQFASGEVAYLLGEAWGQTIGEEDYPVLGGETVYYTYTSCDEAETDMGYSNNADRPAHTPGEDDGDCTTAILCAVCDAIATEAKASHTPDEDDDDCTTAILCAVCGTVTTAARDAHIPGDDDDNCLTPVFCILCSGIAIEAKEEHNFVGGNCGNGGCDAWQSFTMTYYIDGEVAKTETYTCGTAYYPWVAEDKDDLTFLGWAEEEGGELVYAAYDYIWPDEDMEFYAVYGKVYTVTYYSYNYDTGTHYEDGYTASSSGEIKLATEYPYFYKFVGWDENGDGVADYACGEVITLTGDLSLYAVVAPFTASIDLGAQDAIFQDENGEPIVSVTGEMPYSSVKFTSFPMRPGYIFQGFVDSGNGVEHSPYTDEETGETYMELQLSGDQVTLTALWAECAHETWLDATCTAPKTCELCGVTEGDALGHNWKDATCTAPKTCGTCGVTEGDAPGHNWKDATCTTPKTCGTCGVTEGEKADHRFEDGMCIYGCGTLQTFTVTFAGYGTEYLQSVTVEPDSVITLPCRWYDLAYSYGYVFAGYNTEEDGSGETYMDCTEYTVTESVTLYAQWAEIAVGDALLNSGEYVDVDGNVTTTRPEGGYAHFDSGTLIFHDFSYDGEGYLFIHNPDNDSTATAPVYYGMGNLTVVVEGKNVLSNPNDNEEGYGIRGDWNVTVSGTGSLTLEVGSYALFSGSDLVMEVDTLVLNVKSSHGNVVRAVGDITLNSGSVSIEGGETAMFAEGLYSQGNININGGALTIVSDKYGLECSGTLNVAGGTVSITAGEYEWYKAVLAHGGITLENVELQLPKNGRVVPWGSAYTIVDSKGNAATYVAISAEHSHTEETIPGKEPTCSEPGLTDGVKCDLCGEILTPQEEIPALDHSYGEDGLCIHCGERGLYDIWVQGIQVTGGNATDILGDLDEGATVTYDAATNTLYLNNATIGGTEIGIETRGDLNLHITGSNRITTMDSASGTCGIQIANGHLAVDGSGSLNIQAGAAGFSSYGITAPFGLHIKGGSITVAAGEGIVSAGIMTTAFSTVTVDSGASLTATGNPRGTNFGSGIIAKMVLNHGTVNAIAILVPNLDEMGDNTEHMAIFGVATLEEDGPVVGVYHITRGAVLTIAEGVTMDMSHVTADKITMEGNIISNGTVILPDSYTYATIPTTITGGTLTIGESSYIWNGEKYVCVTHVDADNSGYCDTCNCLMESTRLYSCSISLKGNIAINYYMILSDAVAADENAYMQFTMADGEVIKIPVSQSVKTVLEGETYYVFTCEVDAKEMTDQVISQFFYEGGSTQEHTYSVQTYAQNMLNKNPCKELETLIKAMLHYGAASQIHFEYNTDKLANAGLEVPDYSNMTIQGFETPETQGTDLAKLYATSLLLKSETTLRFFFQLDSSVENFTATYDGQTLEVLERNGLYYVDVVGIAAKDLDEAVTITISDGVNTANVTFNPMSYCRSVFNNTTGAFDRELKDLVAALYLYNQAANEYFKES